MFTYRPAVKLNKVEFGSLKNHRVILQLQSGYCILKEYQNKVGIHLHLHLYVEPSRFDFYSTGLTSSGNAGKMKIKENKVR